MCMPSLIGEMLGVVKASRFVFSSSEPLGGLAYEATFYGISLLVKDDQNQFRTAIGVDLYEGIIKLAKIIYQRFVSMLNELQTNLTFYRKHGDAYCNYVRDTAIFAAFVGEMFKIPIE